MTTQNNALSETLRAYVDKVERALERGGVEALARHGIIRDLEGQIAEMRNDEGMSDDAILAALDSPETFVETYGGSVRPDTSAPAPKPAPPLAPTPLPDTRGNIFYALVTVLSFSTILVEMVTNICAMQYFDTMPTYWHMILLMAVPASLLLTSLFLANGHAARHVGWLYVLNGFLVAAGLSYTIAFVPLMPVAFIAILLFGLGLLPLAPTLVLIASLLQGLQLRRQAAHAGARGLWKRWLAGFAVAVLVVGGWLGYEKLVGDAMHMAIRGTMEEREAGLRRLRLLRAESYVLTHCTVLYPRTQRENADTRANRVLYYRLTGMDYREAEKPFGYFVPSWDSEVGGNAVGDKNKNLSLTSAVYDISIASAGDGANAGPGVAYAELTLEFVNSGQRMEEARCQIIMPPGGVASRLTLWIDGEEREAAFGGRGAVQTAYRQVVSRNLDPALLTTAGPDRVLLQCFPVLPGSAMRVKAGFSLPLSPWEGAANLQLPYIAEHNFSLTLNRGISVWAECDAPLSGNDVLRDASEAAPAGKKRHSIRRYVAPGDLAGARISLPLPGAPAAFDAELAGMSAVSALRPEDTLPERLVAVVLDTSGNMKNMWQPGGGDAVPWERILKGIPDGCMVALFAGSAVVPPLSADDAAREWPKALANIEFNGADEQIGNLERAWDVCDGNKNAAVLWLHGSMPVDIADTAGMSQRLNRRPPAAGGPIVFSLQMRPGVNRLEEKLAGSDGLARLTPWFDEPAGSRVAALFSNMRHPGFTPERYSYTLNRDGDGDSKGTRYDHVVRLAAAREVERRLAENGNKPEEVKDAIAIALRLRLVTSGTGAVVLENARQYDQNDLDPSAAADAVPTIPEPEEWAMLAIVAASVCILYHRRKNRGMAA